MAEPRKIVLIHKRSPGDIVCLTALVRDLALNYPGKFAIDVDTTCKDLWQNNPYLTPIRESGDKKNVEYVKAQYGDGIREQNHETIHFAAYFHRDFRKQCGVEVPVLYPHGDLHLSEEERTVPVVDGRYWVVLSGGKSDFTAKVWDVQRMQQVVYELHKLGLGAVQIGSNDEGHWHPPLDGAVNLVGQTNLRDMMQLIHHADGVICGVTAAMHMAAALKRPCVVLGGGREAWWWEGYVNENTGFGPLASGKLTMPHRYLHTIGLLDCCRHHGCWKNKVVPINGDQSLCKYPIVRPGQPVPKCMDMITVEHVMESVMSYYTDKSLPPIHVEGQEPLPPIGVGQPATVRLLPKPPVPPPAANTRRHKASTTLRMPRGPNGEVPQLNVNRAAIKGKPNAQAGVALQPGMPPNLSDDRVFDHADVGGKFTIFVLLYGGEQFYELHRRCLDSIIGSVAPHRMDLRVGSNQLNAKSLAMVQEYVDKGTISKHYRHANNDYKYPVMKEMFNDPDHPIRTKWVVWFDDDSIADRTPAWLNVLAMAITQHHKRDKVHMLGAKRVWTLQSGRQKTLLESRPWYRGRPWRQSNGQPSPNGNKIIFVTGGFWALTKEAIDVCGIPDVAPGSELTHNGGDWMIGEQLYQNGFETKAFNGQKQFVNTSSVDRRGVTTKFPGSSATSVIQQVAAPPPAPVTPPPPRSRPKLIEL